MQKNKDSDLIAIAEAAHILGFKQRKKIDKLIANKFLRTFSKKDSKLIWLSKKEVYELPVALPVPPTKDMLDRRK